MRGGCWSALKERLAKFGLALHEDKTRLIEFGRFAGRTVARRAGERRRRSPFSASPTTAARPGTAGSSSSKRRKASA